MLAGYMSQLMSEASPVSHGTEARPCHEMFWWIILLEDKRVSSNAAVLASAALLSIVRPYVSSNNKIRVLYVFYDQ